jgi:hypothetical protein
MAKEDLAGDQSWVQDSPAPAQQPAASGTAMATSQAGGNKPVRRVAPSGPLTKEEREALLATRTQEVSQMLKGVSAQLTDIQNEAAKSVGKIAESAHLLAATAGQRAMQMLALPALMGLKLALFPLSVTQRLLARFAPPREVEEGEDLPDWDEETAEKTVPEQLGTFNDMLELNIIFMDNQRVPMYSLAQTRGTGRLGKLEEQFIMDNAMQAIRECAEFTNDLPTPSAGPYANEPIRAIMEGVQALDVGRFMAFVKAFPGKYIGKQWKASETFATWLLNNAPSPKG